MSPTDSRHPANPWQCYSVRVQGVLPETSGVATYALAFVDPDIASTYRFRAGQFNMLYVPGIGEAAISISSDPSTPHVLHHTIRSVGGVTQAIAAGGRGMSLGLRGPFGSHWPLQCWSEAASESWDIVLAAGGIGLAPLRSVIYSAIQQRDRIGRVVVLMGARLPTDLLFHQEYPQWKRQGIEVQTTVDRAMEGWQGNVGVVTTLLNRLRVTRPERTIVLSCGPEVMMRYVVQAALQKGISASNLWLSMERNMNCAVGLCGHCQLGPEFICKDGPVLPYTRVVDWLKVHAL